jgi:hypothetical protein
MERLRLGAALILLELRRNLVQYENVSVSFPLHYFSAHPSTFSEKNYLKMSLQFPAGHMQLTSNEHYSPLLCLDCDKTWCRALG